MLLKAAVVFILLATDITGVTEATCERTTREENSVHVAYAFTAVFVNLLTVSMKICVVSKLIRHLCKMHFKKKAHATPIVSH